ncbi:MAG: hypothetical protein KGY69_18165, partial [Bacteroidales bacterium]|nr:hypothetical protein [Bacteroidales bacterium]
TGLTSTALNTTIGLMKGKKITPSDFVIDVLLGQIKEIHGFENLSKKVLYEHAIDYIGKKVKEKLSNESSKSN